MTAERKRLKTVAEGWVPREHGIPSSYNRGCRCDECRAAHAARHRAAGYSEAHQRRNYAARTFVAGRWFAPVPEDKHGRLDTYLRYGCRCVRCTVAIREYNQARRDAS